MWFCLFLKSQNFKDIFVLGSKETKTSPDIFEFRLMKSAFTPSPIPVE